MKKNKVDKGFFEEFNDLISTDFGGVISKINNKEGEIFEMKETKEKYKFAFGKLQVAFVIVVVLAIGVFLGKSYFNNKIMATVNFDVNPSVSLKVNNNKKVVRALPLNADGKKILGSMDLEGSSLEIATNAIIGSLFKNGYIDELKNSVLLSVVGDDEEKNEELRKELVTEIDLLIKNYNVEGSVISQVVKETNEIENLANTYNISIGKAELISKIVVVNPQYKVEDLAKLSINELNLLVNSKKNNDPQVEVAGTASDKAYIGKEKAKEIALKHAGVSVNALVEMDYEEGIMVYEVEFNYDKIEYDYEINAKNGVIIKYDKDTSDVDDDNYENVDSTNTTYIGKAKAKEIALKHAGVSTPIDFDIEFEYSGGVAIYEIDFEKNDKEYDYKINAKTGTIISSKAKVDNDINDNDDNEKDDDYDDEDDD